MTAKRYQEQVLEPHLEELYRKLEQELGGMHFQQDGAASHRTKSTIKWLSDHGIHLLYHPASFPDLNPIECVWHELKCRLRLRKRTPTSLEDLQHAIHEVWTEIPQSFIDHQIELMPERVEAV